MNKGEIGEDIVNKLAYASYLKYWCYPNPIDLNGNRKEICDLLILFFDTAIIISVKNYNLSGNYNRFKKKVITKSSKQLFGAERKLFKSRNDILIAHPEKGEELFNPKQYLNIFRITVSVGEDFENYEFIDSIDGKGIVNIFNKETFEVITTELDTIKDLVEYLKCRESLLIDNINTTQECSEKDLLASYLMNKREFPTEIIDNFKEGTKSIRNKWKVYLNNRSVILKKMAEEKSYFIDQLVKNDVLKMPDGESLAKELMTLDRFERRRIARNLYEIVEKYEDKDDFIARRFVEYNSVGFLFIYYPIEKTQEEINLLLEKAMELYSYFHNSNKIVLLAASKGLKQWKFSLFKAFEVTPEIEKYMIKLANVLGWFKNEKRTIQQEFEYPDQENTSPNKGS